MDSPNATAPIRLGRLETTSGPVLYHPLAWIAEQGLGDPSRVPRTVKVLLDHRHGGYSMSLPELKQLLPAPQVFTWPDEKRPINNGQHARLHAKCAVADGRRAYVSSANLAGYAMNHNLEVGYLVTGGPTPNALDRHLEALCASGHLVLA